MHPTITSIVLPEAVVRCLDVILAKIDGSGTDQAMGSCYWNIMIDGINDTDQAVGSCHWNIIIDGINDTDQAVDS